MGRDFDLHYIDETDEKNLIKIGANQINSMIFLVEKLLTYSTGVCYAITPQFFYAHKKLKFQISFNNNMESKDVPSLVEVYFTSKENSYGIIDMDWFNGNELNFWNVIFKLCLMTDNV